MMLLKRVCVSTLAFAMICYFLPKPLLAQEMLMDTNMQITKHPIESIFTPDEAIARTKDKKSNTLLWGLISAAIIGGVVAVVAGGGSSGGGDDTVEPGTIPVQW